MDFQQELRTSQVHRNNVWCPVCGNTYRITYRRCNNCACNNSRFVEPGPEPEPMTEDDEDEEDAPYHHWEEKETGSTSATVVAGLLLLFFFYLFFG
jgi:hypothetical protein